MKILVVDDHPLFAQGMSTAIKDIVGKTDILSAESCESAFPILADHLDIEWIFLDLNLPGMNGYEFLSELKKMCCPIPVVIISSIEEIANIHNALKLGASGFISKSESYDGLVIAIDSLQKTGRYITPSYRKALDNFRAGLDQNAECNSVLTFRQRQVLNLLAAGSTNKDIAEHLNISVSTIKGHITSIFDILNVNSRTKAIKEAKDRGIINY